jgi:hypothetical protein
VAVQQLKSRPYLRPNSSREETEFLGLYWAFSASHTGHIWARQAVQHKSAGPYCQEVGRNFVRKISECFAAVILIPLKPIKPLFADFPHTEISRVLSGVVQFLCLVSCMLMLLFSDL